jgi:predicted ArsR family transcriptional regulator
MSGNGRENADPILLVQLAGGASIKQAAEAVGISERTARRRMKDDVFVARLEELRQRCFERALDRLGQLGTAAVDTLESLLDAAVSPTVRLGAARAVLEYGLRLRDEIELEERLRALEEKMQT